jgi:hypothetical protein
MSGTRRNECRYPLREGLETGKETSRENVRRQSSCAGARELARQPPSPLGLRHQGPLCGQFARPRNGCDRRGLAPIDDSRYIEVSTTTRGS